MLVLSRKRNQRIQIGDNVTIHIIQSRNGRVRLGIEAPRDVPVVRDDAKRKEKR